MTEPLFRDDAYLREAGQGDRHHHEGGIVLDRSLFYPTGGGQPGDSGPLTWDGGEMAMATAVKGRARVVLLPAEPAPLPAVGQVTQKLDWDRRHRHMRVHTALHLLSVVMPLPVTGGSIAPTRGGWISTCPTRPRTRRRWRTR